MKILLGLTTTDKDHWKDKVKEADGLNLKEIALFLTGLDKNEREEIYKLLPKTSVKKIPFVHARSDMLPEEFKYLKQTFKTKVFNLHSEKEHPCSYDYSELKKFIYIENTTAPFDEKEIKNFAGICLDFTHLEDDRLRRPKIYHHSLAVIKKFKCGCNHISAIKKKKVWDKDEKEWHFDFHYLNDFLELNYLKKYPLSYFSSHVALELENDLAEQIKMRKHVISILLFYSSAKICA